MANSLRINRSSRSKPAILYIIPVLLLLAIVVALFLLLEREAPRIEIDGELDLIGTHREINFAVSDKKSGISHIDAVIRQGGIEKKLFEKNFQRQGYFHKAGEHNLTDYIKIDTTALGFKDGKAEIVFTVRDFSYWNLMRGNITERVFPVTVDTQPPKVSRMDSPRQIVQGGVGIVMYKVSEPVQTHGVRVNDYFHPGFPVPGKNDLFGAIIGLPHDTAKIEDAHVEAVDAAGNLGTAPFGMILKKGNFKRDRINVPETFLDLKIPEFSQYYPEMTGNNLEKYLYVNNKVRRENNKRIMELCSHSTGEQLWQGHFTRMARSSNRAGYADHRTYYYNGKEVDQQTHLGIDLASTRHSEVEAANTGKVVFADYLGIYGNMVILDHGLGVFSLYSHLSGIDVAAGDMVEKGGKIGTTGTSGMAGGDHLHFSMLVNGILVNPLEWWDASWLDLNILSSLK